MTAKFLTNSTQRENETQKKKMFFFLFLWINKKNVFFATKVIFKWQTTISIFFFSVLFCFVGVVGVVVHYSLVSEWAVCNNECREIFIFIELHLKIEKLLFFCFFFYTLVFIQRVMQRVIYSSLSKWLETTFYLWY